MFGSNYFGQSYFGQGPAISGITGLFNLPELYRSFTKYLNGGRTTDILNNERASKALNGDRTSRRIT